jgi:predicted alpha/beta superfamily hydrolase
MTVPPSVPGYRLFQTPWKALVAVILAMGCGIYAQARLESAPMARETVPVALPGTQQHDLVSAVNGRPYRLYVALPDGYDPEGGTRYPVLYLLDGYFAFPAAVSALGSMAIQREVEDVIVVGISEGEHAFDSWFVSRWRDYTPSLDAATDSAGAASFGIPPERVRSGGAPAFLRILREEILPFVEATYRTSDDRGIAGHSFGGLFAAWVLLEAPGLFRRYGLNSPSLWWGGGEMFEREADFAARHGALAAHVFLSVGSEEGRMVSSVEGFAGALRSRGYAGLAVDVVVFDGETHGSVVPAMAARTLRVLYASRPGR